MSHRPSSSSTIELEFEAKKLKTRDFCIRSILHESFTRRITLLTVSAVEITNKKKIPQLLPVLPPLPQKLGHLKRINGNLIILSDTNLASESLCSIKELFDDAKFVDVKVPAEKPKTRDQFIESKSHWPSSFHEDKTVERKLRDILFDEEKSRIYGNLFMDVERMKGGLIFDPSKNVVVVEPMAADVTRPLQHPVMRLIDALANIQLADAKDSTEETSTDQGYLATGLDVVLYDEPCTMCAMALVHSRASRVFFGRPNEKLGALFSRWRIQEQPNINHHYQSLYNILRNIEHKEEFTFCVHSSFRIRELGFRNEKLPGEWNCEDWSRIAILDVAGSIKAMLWKIFGGTTCNLVGIALERSALFVAAVIGVVESGNAFVALDTHTSRSDGNDDGQLFDYVLKKCENFGVSIIVSCNALNIAIDGVKFYEDISRGQKIFFADFGPVSFSKRIPKFERHEDNIVYVIQTSGSTGEPKAVHVPFRAIMPNIIDFGRRFEVGETSKLLLSTSLFFDPSMVEMFLSIQYGAELIIFPSEWTSHNSLFARVIIDHQPFSFVQFTPAVLYRFTDEFLRVLFGRNSPVRNMLIGGEAFPLNFVRFYRGGNCSMNIFNIYGVTEVSCWASIHCVNFCERESTTTNAENRVPIGEPLLCTKLAVDNEDGTLLIGGSRRCFVNFEFNNSMKTEPLKTADFAIERVDELRSGRQIFAQGRQEKSNGILPFTAEIEELFLTAFPKITFAKLVFMEHCRFLFLNLGIGEDLVEIEKIRQFDDKLPKRLRSTRVFFNTDLNEFISKNGLLSTG